MQNRIAMFFGKQMEVGGINLSKLCNSLVVFVAR